MHVLAGKRIREPAPPRLGSGRIRLRESDSLDLISVGKRDADRRIRKQLRTTLNYGIKRRLRVRKRAADNVKHLRGGCLLLKRLGELSRSRLHFFEQPRVLDRDHRLLGECPQQVHLPVREMARRRSCNGNRTDDPVIVRHRH